MRALVVVAHPCDDSFTHAAADAAASALQRSGHEVEVVDLYADEVRSAMTLDERLAYHTDQPVLDDQVTRHIELVRAAQILVFVYPTWWSGLPAILKGWLDRTLVPGVGFVFDEDSGKVRPGLGQVRRIVGISTYGSPRPYVKLVNDNGRRIMTRALRMSCGLRARTTWLALYAMDSTTDHDRKNFLGRIDQKVGAI